jgi:hypothetical protein
VHPGLPLLHSLYADGDAAVLANVGTLVRPMSRADYADREFPKPPSLFAHNIQVRCTQSVHAQDSVAKGVLGRMVDVLLHASSAASGGVPPAGAPPPPPPSPPYSVGAYSLAGIQKMLDGSRPPRVLDRSGAVRFSQYGTLRTQIANLTSGQLRSVFAETFAAMTEASFATSENVGAALDTVTLLSSRWTDTNGDGVVNNLDNRAPHACTTICQQFMQAAKVGAAPATLSLRGRSFLTSVRAALPAVHAGDRLARPAAGGATGLLPADDRIRHALVGVGAGAGTHGVHQRGAHRLRRRDEAAQRVGPSHAGLRF